MSKTKTVPTSTEDSPSSDTSDQPKESTTVSEGLRPTTEDSIDFSKDVTSTDTTRTAAEHKKRTHEIKKIIKRKPKLKKFDGRSCNGKILGILRRKDISGPPLVPKFLYNQRNNYHRKLQECQDIARENVRLVQRITQIYTNRGGIDNKLSQSPLINRPGWFRHHRLLEITNENFQIYRRLQQAKPSISRAHQLAWYAEQEGHMKRKSSYPLLSKNPPCSKKSINGKGDLKQYACLQIGYGKYQSDTENLMIELFTNESPVASRNFWEICEEDNPFFGLEGKQIDKLVSVCTAPNVYRRAYWKVGASTGVVPENETCFLAEENGLKHTEAGLLTRPLKLSTGEFYITIGAAPFLDGKCCIFGRLIADSMAFLYMMEDRNIDMYGIPIKPMAIKGCSTAYNIMDLPGPYLTDNNNAQGRPKESTGSDEVMDGDGSDEE